MNTYILKTKKEEEVKLFWIDAESCKEAKKQIPEGYEFEVLVDIEKVGTVHEYFKDFPRTNRK